MYCDVCIDKDINRVVYPPHDPEIVNTTTEKRTFHGWDIGEGDYLPGVDRSACVICETPGVTGTTICDYEGEIVCPTSGSDTMSGWTVLCGDGGEIVCTSGSSGTIVCQPDEVDYTIPVHAYLIEEKTAEFGVTFLYKDDSGADASHTQTVLQNAHLPRFHIHNHYHDEQSGSNFYFRHWVLESGNLSSSLTVLSPLTFVAVYDEVKYLSEPSPSTDPEGQGSSTPPAEQSPVQSAFSCSHLGEYSDELAHTHDHYCKLCGLDPLNYEDHFEELGDCPYVRILRELYGSQTPKKANNDLKQSTMIEIEDISNLLKALFKVNIDIAHREYFLKIDVPEASNWWYGYTTGAVNTQLVCESGSQQICYNQFTDGDVVCVESGNWISFEPMVELKFSNLHSDNQLDEEGNLICTTKSRADIPLIVPVNRELSFDPEKNEVAQFNDLFYCYDYWKSWKGTHKRLSSETGGIERTVVSIGDIQAFYEVRPLCLYQNTPLQSPTDVNDFVRHRLGEIDRRKD